VIPGVKYPERTKPWGTGHAVLSAKDVIHEPFVVISADDYYGPNAFDLAKDGVEEFVDAQTSITFCYKIKNTLSDHGSVNR
jgi:UTP-glucose-1-phosphate uridylyltransferase